MDEGRTELEKMSTIRKLGRGWEDVDATSEYAGSIVYKYTCIYPEHLFFQRYLPNIIQIKNNCISYM